MKFFKFISGDHYRTLINLCPKLVIFRVSKPVIFDKKYGATSKSSILRINSYLFHHAQLVSMQIFECILQSSWRTYTQPVLVKLYKPIDNFQKIKIY